MVVVRYNLEPDAPLPMVAAEGAMPAELTDVEIMAAAESDPDNPPLTGTELDRIGLARRIKRLRTQLGLSQEAFAACYGIPVATLRQWEMARRAPDRATLSYLQVIATLPERAFQELRRLPCIQVPRWSDNVRKNLDA